MYNTNVHTFGDGAQHFYYQVTNNIFKTSNIEFVSDHDIRKSSSSVNCYSTPVSRLNVSF